MLAKLKLGSNPAELSFVILSSPTTTKTPSLIKPVKTLLKNLRVILEVRHWLTPPGLSTLSLLDCQPSQPPLRANCSRFSGLKTRKVDPPFQGYPHRQLPLPAKDRTLPHPPACTENPLRASLACGRRRTPCCCPCMASPGAPAAEHHPEAPRVWELVWCGRCGCSSGLPLARVQQGLVCCKQMTN